MKQKDRSWQIIKTTHLGGFWFGLVKRFSQVCPKKMPNLRIFAGFSGVSCDGQSCGTHEMPIGYTGVIKGL